LQNQLPDLDELKTQIRRLAEEKLQPLAADTDRNGIFPKAVPELFRSLDMYQLLVPRGLGGLEAPIKYMLTAIEEISVKCAGLAALLSVPFAGIFPILQYMSSDRLQSLNTAYFTGDRLLGYALSGADSAFGETKERPAYIKKGNCYTISGVIRHVLFGNSADAVAVVAYENPENTESDSMLFLIESGTSGIAYGDQIETMGLRALPVAPLYLDKCTIPDSKIIGEAGQTREIIESAESLARLFVAAQSIGIIRSAFYHARSYSMQREQFGQKIGKFQSIEFMLVNMQILLNTGKAIIDRSADAFDNNDEHFAALCAQAKLYCSDGAMTAATDSVQIHGGYGFMRDFPVEKLMRDAKMAQIMHGTPHHLKSFIAHRM